MEIKNCSTCYNGLGGIYACCRINLEAECREGGFEAWEPRDKAKDGGKDEHDS